MPQRSSAKFRRSGPWPQFRQVRDMRPPRTEPTLLRKAAPKAVQHEEGKPMRHTIIVTSILLGMSGATALASPEGTPPERTYTVLIQH